MASAITVGVMFIAVAIFFAGMSSWMRGQGKINAESTSQTAMRIVAKELREAMAISVDTNGYGITYQKPALSSSGAYTVPLTYDGVTRRIELADGTLRIVTGGSARIICKGVITTDPLSTGGTTTYKLFTAGSGTVARSLVVMIATRSSGYQASTVTNRTREIVYLRNIPELTQ